MTKAALRRRVYDDLEQRSEFNDFDHESQTSFMVARLHRLMRNALITAFEPHGASFAEFAVLNIVRSAEPVTNAELARLTKVSPQATNRLVSGLANRGILERLEGPGGLHPIVLSDAGRALHATLCEIERTETARLAIEDPDWRRLLAALLTRGDALIAGAAST